MKNMTLENVAKACGGRLVCEGEPSRAECASVVIDSRQAGENSIFIAVRGERVDGHRFLPDVFQKGALGAVCERLPENAGGPCILVEDSLKALRQIAAFYREQLPAKVVGITGSVGKTSTKEFVAAVLARKYRVHKTQGNFNNEIGVPLTVLSMPEDTEVAVLEMGINHFGEMRRLSRIAQPDICVMTNIGQCHLEFLGSREGILKAKSEIFEHMREDGRAVLNGDDDMLAAISQVKGKAPLLYGIPDIPDGEAAGKYGVYAKEIRKKGLLGSEAVFCHAGKEFAVRVPLPGAHMVYNALAAAEVGFLLGLSPDEITAGLAEVRSVSGRSRVLRAGSRTVIDDCYNANPVSVEAAVDLLVQDAARRESSGQAACSQTASDQAAPGQTACGQPDARRVAVLGDMLELGEEERLLHERVGRYCVKKGVDCLICAGPLSEATYEGALSEAEKEGKMPSGGIHYFPDRAALLAGIGALLEEKDTILIKASHSMGFEEAVKLLTSGWAAAGAGNGV